MIKRNYYLVHETGKSMEAIREFHKKFDESIESIRQLKEELGASNVMTACEHIIGFCFDNDPGKGWRKSKKGPYFKPHEGTKAGKEIAKKMNRLRYPGAGEFCLILDAPFMVMQGNHFASTIFQKIGEQYVISVPSISGYVPPDTTPLKLSEYFAMKEAEEEREVCG